MYLRFFFIVLTLINRGLFIFILVLGLENIAYTQPANDDCNFSEDISDQLWHTANNINASANCGTDINTSNCKSPYQATDMCCGFDGTESSIFFNFTIPSNDLVYIDFRNIVCNPVSFFGVTTALQGFVFTESSCVNVDNSVIKSCFNATSAADINGQMSFNAVGGQLYQIMIDTKKNSVTSCGSGCIKATNCHSTCNWEIRLRTNTVTLLKDFNLSIMNAEVVASWFYDFQDNYTHFKIIRKKLADNTSEVVSEGLVNSYQLHGYDFEFEDHSVKENGLYTYYLEGSLEGVYFNPVVNKTIFVGYVDEIDAFLIPNPAKDDLKISVINVKDGIVKYEIYSTLGVMVLSGKIDSQMQYSLINTCLLPTGMYFVKVIIGNTILSKKLLLN
jgi:hypothetical protein